MSKTAVLFAAAGLVAVAAMAWTAPEAFADPISYKIDLKASSEVPPTKSPGTGTAVITFDPATKIITWIVTYFGTDRSRDGRLEPSMISASFPWRLSSHLWPVPYKARRP